MTVISTLCIENKCPNAFQVQRKTLSSIIGFRKNGLVDTRVWCLFCRQTEAFHNIIPKLLEKHPKKHFVLLHPDTKATCTSYSEIMTALHAYRALQPEITPANLKVVVRSTHVATGGCRCAQDFVNEHSLFNIAFNLEDGPNSRVWSKECARKTISEDRKVLYPKGVDTTGTIESIRHNMLAQLLEELSDLTICRIQQGRIYDALISNKASPGTLGAVVQFASGCLQKNGSFAAFNKEITRIIDILESGALFIGQEMSKDGQTMNRILVLPPCALDRVMNLKVKSLRLTNPVTKILKEFVFECNHPEQMQNMVRLIEAHIADPTSLCMDLQTANAHMDSINVLLEHIGIEAILKHHYSDTNAGIRIMDSCQGDFVAFQKVVEVKTLRFVGKLYNTGIKPMPLVDMLIGLVLASDVRVKANLLLNEFKDRRLRRQPCDDLILKLEDLIDGPIIDGIFKFVDPSTSVLVCPKDKRDVSLCVSQIDGKVVPNPKYIHDVTKVSYIDTRNVPNRDLLELIFNNNF